MLQIKVKSPHNDIDDGLNQKNRYIYHQRNTKMQNTVRPGKISWVIMIMTENKGGCHPTRCFD